MASNFSVNLSYKHLQGLVRVAENVEANVCMAMETVSDDAACVFLFTKGTNLKYTIGVSNVKF